MQRLALSIRRWQGTPNQWQHSMSFQLDKQNNKPGCQGIRLVSCLDPCGAAYYKHLWRRCRPCSHRPYAAGYCRQKSRLEPICQQNVVSHRLRSRKVSHACSFLMFKMRSALDSVARLEDRQLWEQRYREALVRVSDGRAEADFRPHSGTMQGDGPSAELFLEPYHPQLDKWAQATAINDPRIFLVAKCVFLCGEAEQDLSLSSVADDVGRISLGTTPEDLRLSLEAANAGLDRYLWDIGLVQNVDKQEHVLFFGERTVLNTSGLCTVLLFCQAELCLLLGISELKYSIRAKFTQKLTNDCKLQNVIGQKWVLSCFVPSPPNVARFWCMLLLCILLLCLDSNFRFWMQVNTNNSAVWCSNMVANSCKGKPVPNRSCQMPRSSTFLARPKPFGAGWACALWISSCRLGGLFGISSWPKTFRNIFAFSWQFLAGSGVKLATQLTQPGGFCRLPTPGLSSSWLIFNVFKRSMRVKHCLIFWVIACFWFSLTFCLNFLQLICPSCGEHLTPSAFHHRDGSSQIAQLLLWNRQAFSTLQALEAHKSSAKGGSHDDISQIAWLATTNACPFCKNVSSSKMSARNHIRRSLQTGGCGGSGSHVIPRLKLQLTYVARFAKSFSMTCICCWTMWPVMSSFPGPKQKTGKNSIVCPFLSPMALTPWVRTGAADGKSAKRQAAGSEKFLMKGIQVLTKLALKNAMDVRELQAASLMTVQLPKDNPMIQVMLTATRAFNDEQEKAKSSNTSPPEGQPHWPYWKNWTRMPVSRTRKFSSSMCSKAVGTLLWLHAVCMFVEWRNALTSPRWRFALLPVSRSSLSCKFLRVTIVTSETRAVRRFMDRRQRVVWNVMRKHF